MPVTATDSKDTFISTCIMAQNHDITKVCRIFKKYQGIENWILWIPVLNLVQEILEIRQY